MSKRLLEQHLYSQRCINLIWNLVWLEYGNRRRLLPRGIVKVTICSSTEPLFKIIFRAIILTTTWSGESNHLWIYFYNFSSIQLFVKTCRCSFYIFSLVSLFYCSLPDSAVQVLSIDYPDYKQNSFYHAIHIIKALQETPWLTTLNINSLLWHPTPSPVTYLVIC